MSTAASQNKLAPEMDYLSILIAKAPSIQVVNKLSPDRHKPEAIQPASTNRLSGAAIQP